MKQDIKARVIIQQGMFVPEIKLPKWGSQWEGLYEPGITFRHMAFKTLEEALDALKKSKANGEVVWEGLLSELQSLS